MCVSHRYTSQTFNSNLKCVYLFLRYLRVVNKPIQSIIYYVFISQTKLFSFIDDIHSDMYQINNRHDARIFERKVRNRNVEKYVFWSVLITCWRPNDIDNSQTKQHHDTKCIPQIEHNTRWLKIHHNFCVEWVENRVCIPFECNRTHAVFAVRVWDVDVDVLLLFQSILSICSSFRFSFPFFEHLFAQACNDEVDGCYSFLSFLLSFYFWIVRFDCRVQFQ